MQLRIAIAVEPDQARWIAYGGSDVTDCDSMATVRDIVEGHPVTMWLEVQIPEQQPATVPAHVWLHTKKYEY